MHALNRATRPAEIYARMSDILRGMEVGARMPPYRELKARLDAPQRSIDLVYERLEEEGAVRRRQGDATYVLDPWAGGSFVCLLSSGYLMGDAGTYARLFYLALERLVHANHPKTSTLILMTTEGNFVNEEREKQVRERLPMLQHQTRLLGAFSTYELRMPATQAVCRKLNLPCVSFWPPEAPGSILFPTSSDLIETGLRHLAEEGWRDIQVMGMSVQPAAVRELAARLFPNAAGRPKVECHVIPQDLASWQANEDAWIAFIRARIRANSLPEALLFADDTVCRMALLGASMEGVSLAERCAIVTQSSKDLPVRATRDLTRLEFDFDLIAAEALRMMESLLRGAVRPHRNPIPVALHVGRSSRRGDYR